MTNFNIIIEFVLLMALAYVQIKTVLCLFKEDYSEKILILSAFLINVFYKIVPVAFHLGFVASYWLYLLSFILCFKLLFKKPFYKSTMFLSILISISICVEALTVGGTELLRLLLMANDMDFCNYLDKIILYRFIILVIHITIYNIIRVTNRRHRFAQLVYTNNYRFYFFILTFGLSLLLHLLYFITFPGLYLNGANVLPLMVNILIIVALLLVSVLDIIKIETNERMAEDAKKQKEYVYSLESSLNMMRSFKHDYNNTVQIIKGYISLKNYEALEQYVNSLVADGMYVNNLQLINSSIKNIPYLYGLLLNKICVAEAQNIRFIVDINNMKSNFLVPDKDMGTILGILLDNALEASATSLGKKVVFQNLNIDENYMVISISNTYSEDVDLTKIFIKDYTTKPNHSGFGLWEVKKIVYKYSDVLELLTDKTDELLIQKLIVKLY